EGNALGNHADRQSNTLNMGAIALKTERATFFEDVLVGLKETPVVGCSKGLDAEIQTIASAPPTCDQFHRPAPPRPGSARLNPPNVPSTGTKVSHPNGS
ncbi:MAG: hypothetical protein VXZ63_13955, partial [Planctomycetota bacterium]|nr:hypothetical protein [Planctomycetota bacterium]